MAYRQPSGSRLKQGDVLSNVRTFSLRRFESDQKPFGDTVYREHSIVVTQECDLEQDFKARFPSLPATEETISDKLIFGVILCGVHRAAAVKAGTYRPNATVISSKSWNIVETNREPRYQYLGVAPDFPEPLVADFKDFFFVPPGFLYSELESGRTKRLVELASPWREHLLQRFAWYLMRVGLPTDFHHLKDSLH